MKEILFKAKRKDNGEWVYGYLINRVKSIKNIFGEKRAFIYGQRLIYNSHLPDEIVGYEYEVIPETVCQYTGLMDKNGKKIFENDVCLCPYIDPIFLTPWSKENVEKCNIVYYMGCFAVQYEEKGNVALHQMADTIEIIGNIHDGEEKHD